MPLRFTVPSHYVINTIMFQERTLQWGAVALMVTAGLIAATASEAADADDSRLETSRVHAVSALGLWDAVIPLTNSDQLLLRRADRLWLLDMSGLEPPLETLQSKLLSQADFVFTAGADQQKWVFCNSKVSCP
ncbi:MAG: hypothetical protein WBD31_21140, partial [Rubripirellula sp.]